MNDLSGEELKVVFQLCQPNPDGLISLTKLQSLLDQHTNQLPGSTPVENKGILNDFQDASSNGDDWISFDEFCQGVSSLLESPASSQQVNQAEEIRDYDQNSNSSKDFVQFEGSCRTEDFLNQLSSHNSEQNLLISLDSCTDLNENRPDFFLASRNSASTFTLLDPLIQDTLPPAMNSTKASAPPHRSPLRIDVTSSSEDGTNHDDTSPYSLTDSAMGGSAMSPEPLDESPASVHDKSHCSSMSDDREVNFESYGENNDVEYDHDLVDFDDVDSTEKSESSSTQKNSTNFIRRNAWMRTSLRRSPANNDQLVPPKRWGSFRHSGKRVSSNAYASALYHHNGANSSGRSSNCDDGDMQSDISLEDDVIDLNQKVQILQDQVGQLAESQASTDDRYSKVRQENVSLNQRIHVLEEQLREMDQRSDEKLADEQKRNRELLARMEREKQLEIENYSIRLQSMERDYNSSVREVTQLKSHNDRLKAENNSLEQELFETQQSLSELQKEFQRLQDATKREQDQVAHERQMNEHIVEELSRELETLKSSSFSRGMVAPSMNGDLDLDSSPASLLNGALNSGLNSNHSELEDELKSLRVQNKRLQESNDELEAVLMNRSLEQGKAVLSQTNREGTSIEMELRNMDDNQLRTALKEQQEVNSQLRGYIDGILMNIIDKYPELLEVRK